MHTIELLPIVRQYKNNGQHAEQVFRFTFKGTLEKADNKPFDLFADIDDVQIKSARATVCKGTDLKAYLMRDKAKRYAYVVGDFKKAYIMSKEEWQKFCEMFGTITHESKSNGNGSKIRLKHESKALLEWLQTT